VPRLIETSTEDKLELAELVELLETGDFDADDEDNFASWGTQLKKLANNRTFLADMMIAELKQRCDGQIGRNQYTAQVVMLHGASSRYFIRANLWPALKDSVVRHSGTNPFFYGVPHDHNFSFLTVGYLGPGYWSDYYEYEYGEVVGYAGEKVNLRFVEKSRLEQGKVMLYRAHRDVHSQLPADAMSISLNILEASHVINMRDQYRFDLEKSEIGGIITQTALDPLLQLSAHFGGEKGIDLLDSFAAGHPSDRIRWKALQARAGSLDGLDARIALYERAARGANRYVAEMAKREALKLERGRAWIENAPAVQAAE
jgi:hypothetical protein